MEDCLFPYKLFNNSGLCTLDFLYKETDMKKKNTATIFAILAAALYAVNVPLSKLLLAYVNETMMAAFLYLGAGIGLFIYSAIKMKLGGADRKEPLTKKELPYTAAMVILDIAAPIFLMAGIARTNSANVSLLNNFEIVATSLVALIVFHEVISKRLWLAILLVTIASIILSFEGQGSFSFNEGSLFVLAACVCWGFENNCTKMISNKSSEEIVIIKGCFSGLGSLLIGLLLGGQLPQIRWMLAVMLLGFVAYGLSINFYIMAQKDLGAAKTSAYYSIAPFLGVAFSMILIGERPELQFYAAFALMVVSAVFMVKDTVALQHTHLHTHTHTHEHRHGNLVHTHEHTHEHEHLHVHEGDETVHSHKYRHDHEDDALAHMHSHSGLEM